MAYGFNNDKSKHGFELGATNITPTSNETIESVVKRMFEAIISIEDSGKDILFIDIDTGPTQSSHIKERFYVVRNGANTDGTVRVVVIAKSFVNWVAGYEKLTCYTYGYQKSISSGTVYVNRCQYDLSKPNPNNTSPTANATSATMSDKFYGNIKIVWLDM